MIVVAVTGQLPPPQTTLPNKKQHYIVALGFEQRDRPKSNHSDLVDDGDG